MSAGAQLLEYVRTDVYGYYVAWFVAMTVCLVALRFVLGDVSQVRSKIIVVLQCSQ